MTTYTTPHNLPILETSDLIAASTDGLRQDLNGISTAANSALDAVKWDKGVNAADLNTIQSSGRWAVNSTTTANLPVAVAGTVHINWGSTTGTQTYVTREATPRVYHRAYLAGAWGAWTSVLTDAKAYADSQDTAKLTEAKAYTDQKKWDRGVIPTNTDLNTLKAPGVYSIPSSTVAQSLANRPPIAAVGRIEVVEASTANGVWQQTLIGYDTSGRATGYQRQSLSGTFSQPWEAIKWTQPTVANGTNWNTVTTVGVYQLDNRTNAGTMTNLPPSETTFAGTMEVLPVALIPNARVMQRGTEYAAGSASGRTWQRIQEIDGTFTPWETVTPKTGVAANVYKHQILEQTHRRRRGGKYGSGGKTLVALRLDDSYTPLLSKVLPMLQARRIPATIAVTAAEWDLSYNTGTTWAQLQAAAINNGWELCNHANNHTDANTLAELKTTIIGALTTIRANMPKIAIDGFIPPGVGTSGSKYMGFDQGVSPEAFHNTPAGVMLLNEHAYVTGNMEYAQPLDGVIKHGIKHLPLDNMSNVTDATNQINRSSGLGVGLMPMLHPYRLDELDRTTSARFETFLDYLVQERDAGRIDLVTIGTLMTADAGSSYRHDMARSGSWVSGSQTISLADQPYLKGGVRELTATGSGSMTFTVTDNTGALNVTRTFTPTGGTGRLPFTIPLDATSITCTVTGGTNPKVLAV